MSSLTPLPLSTRHHEREGALFGPLSAEETRVEERLRTLALCVCATAVVGGTLFWMRGVLVPFVLAVALKQLLTPVVDGLRKLSLPHTLAALIAMVFAAGLLFTVGLIVADSITQFSARSGDYYAQVQQISTRLIQWMDQQGVFPQGDDQRVAKITQLLERIPVGQLALTTIEGLLAILSNLMLVLLFAVYLLLGSTPEYDDDDFVSVQIDQSVRDYIKGKVLLSFLAGVLTSLALWTLHIDLYVVFGMLAFWLNFVPNVGALVAVALPMPLVLFNPSLTAWSQFLALALPLGVHMLIGNLLEPLIFGRSMSLHPVVVLLSLVVWSAIWGVTGMVLAVPLTAMMRIHLSHIDHPLTRMVLRVLDGGEGHRSGRGRSRRVRASGEDCADEESERLTSS